MIFFNSIFKFFTNYTFSLGLTWLWRTWQETAPGYQRPRQQQPQQILAGDDLSFDNDNDDTASSFDDGSNGNNGGGLVYSSNNNSVTHFFLYMKIILKYSFEFSLLEQTD